jgi:uncharacterized RDD family membrane protein YckC
LSGRSPRDSISRHGMAGEGESVIRDCAPPAAPETKVVGRRIAAFLVDNVVMVVLILLCETPYVLVLLNLDPAFYERVPALVLIAIISALYSMVVLLGVTIGYYALLEGYRGQTFGKMLFGLEVIREETGAVPGPKAAALRAVMLLLADAQFLGVVGLSVILLSEKRQRIGDMAAGTLVIRKACGVRR